MSKRLAANRQNAQLSTGPRTRKGKRAVSQNAWRHGLAGTAPLHEDEAQLIDQLAAGLADGRSHLCLVAAEAARLVYRLEQIAAVRRRTVAMALQHCKAEVGASTNLDVLYDLAVAASLPDLVRLDTYERKTFSKLRKRLVRL